MAFLDAMLAFALVMLVLATLASVLSESFHRLLKLRQ